MRFATFVVTDSIYCEIVILLILWFITADNVSKSTIQLWKQSELIY